MTFKEMGFSELDSRSEARICMVFGVPPIIIGAKVGLDRATYANYGEALRAWWQHSLLPRYKDLQDIVTTQLVTEFSTGGPAVEAKWDKSQVPALQEERTARWTRASTALATGGITVNEYRIELGLAPVGPSGDVFLRTANQIPTSIDGNDEEPVNDGSDSTPDEEFLEEEGKQFKSAMTDKERADFEKLLTKDLIGYFHGQTNRLKEALDEKVAG
jgi:hypothetical protein